MQSRYDFIFSERHDLDVFGIHSFTLFCFDRAGTMGGDYGSDIRNVQTYSAASSVYRFI
jgi:hypothetical protein